MAGSVEKIVREIARTKFFLQTENDDGEIELIKSHQALVTLDKPQPTKKGKAILTGFNLKLVTGMHLCLVGGAFWLLDERMSDRLGGAPRRLQYLFDRSLRYITFQGGRGARIHQFRLGGYLTN